ncbi:MAG: hypothetical protein ACYCVH_13080 [Ignavibacteriaceae bacterium]
MRILLNDHSGHPFTIQLGRTLSRIGYTVIYTYPTNFQSPKGNFSKESEVENNLKYSLD